MTLIINKSLTPPDVSRETMEKFKEYYCEVLKWNKGTSLMNDLESFDIFYKRHIYDAIQLFSFLESEEVLDIGSGGGVPAIPLCILGKNVIMIESNIKKSTFLSYCVKKFNLIGEVICERIEKINDLNVQFMTARALSDLKTLVKYMNIVSRETIGVFLKGDRVFEEIDDAQKEWLFDVEIYRTMNDKGYVVIIKNVERK